MTATSFYATATLHINNHPYTALIPPHTQVIPYVVEKGIFFAPIYEALDHRVPQRGKITIANMVELIVGGSSFTILDDHDVLAILHQIDCYVEEVYPMMYADPKFSAYVSKILKLRDHVYKVFFRVLSRHPNWKEAYTKDMGVFGFINDLYKGIGMRFEMPTTLLKELELCPTVRQHPDSFNLVHKGTRDAPNNEPKVGGLYDV